MSGRLAGRRFIVTGAASGIGRATAELFAREGARLALIDRTADGVQAVADAVSAVAFAADIADRKAVIRCVADAVVAMDGLDGVVNVAGIHRLRLIEDATDEDWDEVLAVNLTGPYTLIQAALPHLRNSDKPTIVNISSGTALMPTLNGMSAYVASKGGLVSLSKALAFELAPKIRVNVICQGSVVTGLLSPEHVKFAESEASPYALRRSADPMEVANGILYLSCEESSYVTGVALAIDGGRTFH